MPAFAGPEVFYPPHRITGGDQPGGWSTTLAAASIVGATNLKLTSVASIVVGHELITKDTNTLTEEVFFVAGPIDANGDFNGTAGAGGTGVNVDHAAVAPHANATPVAQQREIYTAFDDPTGTVTVYWSPALEAATYFVEYEILRWNYETQTWDHVTYISTQATTSYIDPEANIGVSSRYRVVQNNGYQFSDPAETYYYASNKDWYWVPQNHPELIAKIYVIDYNLTNDLAVNASVAVGRSKKILDVGQLMDPDGYIQIQILDGDRGTLDKIHESLRQTDSQYVAIKNYRGEVFRGWASGPLSRSPFGGRIPAGETYRIPFTVTN